MEQETSCAYCAHRRPRRICGHPQSPLFERTVTPDDTCDRFTLHEGARGIDEAWKTIRAESTPQARRVALDRLLEALATDLTPEDEFRGNMNLGMACLWNFPMDISEEESNVLAMRGCERGLSLVDAAGIDLRNLKKYFLRLDCRYADMAGRIESTQGRAAAIAFLEDKIEHFGHRLEVPLICTRWELAERYALEGRQEAAMELCQAIAGAEISDPDPDAPPVEASYQQLARQQIARASGAATAGPTGAPSPMPSTSSRCFVATAACGDAGAWEVRVLRRLRDEVLVARAAGRVMVGYYELLSPTLAALLARSSVARALVRTALVRPIAFAVHRARERRGTGERRHCEKD